MLWKKYGETIMHAETSTQRPKGYQLRFLSKAHYSCTPAPYRAVYFWLHCAGTALITVRNVVQLDVNYVDLCLERGLVACIMHKSQVVQQCNYNSELRSLQCSTSIN